MTQADVVYVDLQARTTPGEQTLREFEKTAQTLGQQAGNSFGEGFRLNANGRLVDARGRFVKAGTDLGDAVTDGMVQGLQTGGARVQQTATTTAQGIRARMAAGLGGALEALDFAGVNNGFTDMLGGATRLTPVLLGVGAALGVVVAAGAGIAASINTYADLEKALNALKAVSQATGNEMAQLKDQALTLGQSTSFSASQVVKAQEDLSKAGVSIRDILDGATEGSLLLAAATGVTLAQAVDIAAKAMNVFGLAGRDIAYVADVISNGANQSALDVGTFATALQAVGAVAPQSNLNLETTTAVLSLFANNALEGSDAGTSLKTMLLALTAPSSTAAAELKRIGVNVFDAQGAMRPFPILIQELNTKFAAMSEEQRNASMETIFGTDAIRAAGILYKEGSTKLFEYTQAMHESGSAAENAKTRQEGLRGAQEQLSGAMETLQANVGQFFAPAMQTIVEWTTKAITGLSDLAKAMDSAFNTPINDNTVTGLQQRLDALLAQRQRLWTDAATARQSGWMSAEGEEELTRRVAALNAAITELRKQLSQAGAAAVQTQQAQTNWQGPMPGAEDPRWNVSGQRLFGSMGVGGYRITQELGENPQNAAYKPFAGKTWAGHEGVDIATPVGTAVEAAFTGLIQLKTNAAYGKYIELVDEKGQKLILAHLSAYAAGLEAQVKAAGGKLLVNAGQTIGYTGNTGNSTGPHLHVSGVNAQGKWVDPRTIDWAGMAPATYQPGDPTNTAAPDWDKLLAKARELKRVFDEAAPGSVAAIQAKAAITNFQKSSEAAKAAYSEIERAAGSANRRVSESDEQREQRLYREKVAQDALVKSLRSATDERLAELKAQGVQGQSLQKWEAVRAEIARREAEDSKETRQEREARQASEIVAQEKLVKSLRSATGERLAELNALQTQGQSFQKWEAVRAEIARREAVRNKETVQDATEVQQAQAEAQRNAEAAARQADQLATRAAAGSVEAARIRSQSLKASRDEAVQAAGSNLDQVLAVQQAYAPKLEAAAASEAQATLNARKLTNQQWREGQEAEARQTITNQTQLTARLRAIEEGWKTENSNAYRAYYSSLGQAATSTASTVEAAAQRVADAALAQASALNDADIAAANSRFQNTQAATDGAYRLSYGAGDVGLIQSLAATTGLSVAAIRRDVEGALKQAQQYAPQAAAIIERVWANALQHRREVAEADAAFNMLAQQASQDTINQIAATQDTVASYGETLSQLTGILSEAIGQEIDPRQSGFIGVLDGIIAKGGEAAQAAQYVKDNLDELLATAGATDLGTILYRGRKAVADATAANNAPVADGGTTLEQSTANQRAGELISEVFESGNGVMEQVQAAIAASLSDTFSDIGADGREAFWSRFAELSGSTEYQNALAQLGGPELYALIQAIGDAPEWADLKATLQGRLTQAFNLTVPVAPPDALRDYLDGLVKPVEDAQAQLDAGLISPEEFAAKIRPVAAGLEVVAKNLDLIGKSDAAASVRLISQALGTLTQNIADPDALATATAIAAQTYQQSLTSNAATLENDRATYRARLQEEIDYWQKKLLTTTAGSAEYLTIMQRLAGLTSNLTNLDLSITVKVFGVDTGIKQLDLYKTALTGVSDIIQGVFRDLVAGSEKGSLGVVGNMAKMALGIVKSVAISIAAYQAQAIALALISGASFNFIQAGLALAAAAAVAGIAAGLESRLGQSTGASSPVSSSAGSGGPTSAPSETTSNASVNIPSSAVTVIAAPEQLSLLTAAATKLDSAADKLVQFAERGVQVRSTVNVQTDVSRALMDLTTP